MSWPQRSFFSLPSFRSLLIFCAILGMGSGLLLSSTLLAIRTRAAASIYWDGGGDGTSWSNAANWSTDQVPTSIDDVLIDTNATVTISEPISVNSLVLGKITGTATPTLNFAYDAISHGPFTVINGDFIVYGAANVTHSAGNSGVVGTVNIASQNGNIGIYGNINVDSKGYALAQGPGVGNGGGASGGGAYGGNGGISQSGILGGTAYGDFKQPNRLGSGGGDYGSRAGAGGGAIKISSAGTTTINGILSANGGGSSTPFNNLSAGGGSGGSIWINTQTLAGSGTIRANGGSPSDGRDGDGGGGGGGRVALHYTTNSASFTALTALGGRTQGAHAQHGGAGTIYTKSSAATNGDLLIDNESSTWFDERVYMGNTPLDDNLVIDNLTIRDYSRVDLDNVLQVVGTLLLDSRSHLYVTGAVSANTLTVSNNGWIYNEETANISYNSFSWNGAQATDNGGSMPLFSVGGSFTVPTGSIYYANTPRTYSSITINGTVTHYANSTSEDYKINLTSSGDFTLNSAGSINVDTKGFTLGQGPGVGNGGGASGGGAYGGNGGNSQSGILGGTAYGDYKTPDRLGSGGGDYGSRAGVGGGAVKISVSGTATLNGTISANGGSSTTPFNNLSSGGGSGGSIWVTAGTLSGNGTLRANGGSPSDGRDGDGGGGGGGRIALYYTTSNANFANLMALGGRTQGVHAQHGGAGTIYTKSSSATNGDLLIDNEASTWFDDRTNMANTPLPNNSTLDNITLRDYARMDVTETLTVSNTLTVGTRSHLYVTGTLSAATLVANSNGWIYNEDDASISYSSINWSGGFLTDNGGNMPMVAPNGHLSVPAGATFYANVPRSVAQITINGTVTHYLNSTSETYKINLTASGNISVSNTGSINVDARGYALGQGPGTAIATTGGAGGGGYGGAGGNGRTGAGGTTYGDERAPDRLGSGGGDYSGRAGAGGGAIKLVSSGTTTINGTISANGGAANGNVSGHVSGGGSGGSIWIVTNLLEGSGTVRANGGNSADSTNDGGGGGGGRIALYFSTNTALFSALTANGGTAASTGFPGENGTIFLGGVSSDPINLRQFKADQITAIGQGAILDETNMYVTFQVQDGDDEDVLTPEVEIQPVGTNFNDIATNVGEEITYNGSIVTAAISISSLADGTDYHWQARACDASDLCSNWVSFGSNAEADADVRVVLNTPPSAPVVPDSSFFINGQFTNNLQPTIGFVLSDPNNSDTVKYRIQINDSNTFTAPLLDYTSDLGAQGTREFTVGQAAGEGSYLYGEEGQELETGNYYWRVQAIDNKGGTSAWTTAAGTPAFKVDQSRPTNASDVIVKSHVGASLSYSLEDELQWFSRNDLYFSWTAGTDTEGVKGYCLYLGADEAGDPATQKGLLGTSPISTTGTTCQFITDDTEIDFSASSLRSFEWLSSSADPYYFKVKTIDIANNTYVGDDDTNYVSFKFDKTPPQTVPAISASGGVLSSTADMYFNWPTSGGQAASDTHSGILGFQYALNSTTTWYGDTTDEKTGYDYYTMGTTQPFYLPDEVQDLVQLGQNILYFRVLDQAGNISEMRTAYMNFGGEAPKFLPGTEVAVTPGSSESNYYAFAWPEAIASEGNSIARYYYMVNTPPPVSLATITSNSSTYKATTSTSVPAATVAGLRKGANTIYVVAVDDNNNYASTNAISATFYLNTEMPDPPQSVAALDGSIKDASLWRASIIWNVPEYTGTGDLTYHVQRSEDGESWEEIATTTGLAYIDTVPESKQYYWRVGSTDNSDESIASPSYSNAVSLVPRGKYLEPAVLTSGPAASSITTTKATISWTTGRNSDSRIAFGEASGNYFESEPSTSTQTTEHKIVLTNLKPGKTYYYKAKWTDEDGNVGVSEEKTFKTEPPPSVKDVSVTSVGVSSAILNFTTTNATSAKVYYGTSTEFGGVKTVGTSKLETSYSVELNQLQDGTRYYYKINTFDSEEAEYEGTTLDFETMPRPEVSNVQVEQITNTAQASISVTWDSNTEVSSIVTYYPEDRPELVRDNVDVKLSKGKHSMIIKGLFPDTTYVIRVSGRDVIGNEAVSENIVLTTSSDTRAPVISDVRVEGSNLEVSRDQNNPSQLIISWTTDEPATSQVEYGEGSGETFSQLSQEDVNLSLNHMVIIPNLGASKVYHFRAISRDSAGNEAKSVNTVTITPKATDNAFDLVITNLREAFGFLSDIVE